MKFHNFFLLFFFIPFFLFSQEPQGSTGDIVLYRNEMHGGPFVHDKGFGVFYRKGFHRTGKRKLFFETDLLNLKHPKEFKSDNPFENGRYVYGKINSLILLRLGAGNQITLFGKEQRKGVEVRFHYFVGPSLGFLKPVYLEIIHNENNDRQIVAERHDPNKHHISNIYGKSPFTKGFNEMSFEPGLFGKFGFSFEYSPFDEVVRALETGFVLDGFRREVPIMSGLTKNNQFFMSFYLSLVFGKREF